MASSPTRAGNARSQTHVVQVSWGLSACALWARYVVDPHAAGDVAEANGEKGDAAFFAALKSLLAQSPNHKISTRDLQAAFEKVLPASLTYEGRKSLDWFFDSWVNGASIPQFNLEDVKITPWRQHVRVTGVIKETHTGKDTVTAVPIFAVDQKAHRIFWRLYSLTRRKTLSS